MRQPNKILAFLLISIFLLAVAAPAVGANPQTATVDVLIGFADRPDAQLVQRFGGQVAREFSLVPVIAARMSPQAAAALTRNPRVSFVEPDGMVHAVEVAAASLQSTPWGIKRVFGPENYPFSTWNNSTGLGVGLAILDTGIDINHPDLSVAGGANTIDKTHWGTDDNGHGTHVAGSAAALDNQRGVVGVAPALSLYAVKVLDNSGNGTISSVVAGIEWAVQQGIPVLNLSLGTSSHFQTLQNAVDTAYGRGHLLIAAAGNSGSTSGKGNNVSYPARYSSVIAVAASDLNDRRASWSSTGPDVELIAPGVSIYSTLPSNSYGTGSGTSMAAPHAAGVAALAWAANRGLNNAQLRQILHSTAEHLGLAASHQGYGLARADLAVAAALPAQPPPPVPTHTVSGTVTDTGTGTAVPSATVTIVGTEQSATTDDEGRYTIPNVKEGTYTITALAAGYHPETRSVTVTGELILDITLTAKPPNGQMNVAVDAGGPYRANDWVYINVTITDTGNHSPINGATAAMTIYSPNGAVVAQSTGTTDSKGLIQFRWKSGKRSQSGTYTVTVSSAKDGYDPATSLATFELR